MNCTSIIQFECHFKKSSFLCNRIHGEFDLLLPLSLENRTFQESHFLIIIGEILKRRFQCLREKWLKVLIRDLQS